MVAVLLGIVISVENDKGTVKIVIDDPNAKVTVDHGTIRIDNLDQPLTLRAGDHEMEVTYGDLHVEAQ